MRILHVNNQASVGYLLSRAQRELGHVSDLLAQPNPYQRAPDHTAEGVKGIFLKLMALAPGYDLIHVHGGIGISGVGMAPLKVLRKRFFAHYHGSELRSDIQTSFHMLAERIFVSTPDLLAFSGHVGGRELIHIPNPVFVEGVEPVDWEARMAGLEGGAPLRIVHLPSVREVKGTDFVLKAVEEARERGARVELDIVENVPVADAMKRLEASDLCIDWMSPDYRIHGVVSIEAMLRAIPVICNIDLTLYPEEIPIISAPPGGLAEKLLEIDRMREELPRRGKLSREYAIRMHHPMKAARMIEEYL